MAASLIAMEGLDVKTAMEEVLNVRSIAFSAEGWFEFGKDVLEEFYALHWL